MKQATFFVIVLLIGGWLISGVVSDLADRPNELQTIVQGASQAASQAAGQAANLVDFTPSSEPNGATPTPYVSPYTSYEQPEPVRPSMPAEQLAELRAWSVSLHGVVSALMFDSVLERCTNDVMYCGEAMVLRALVQQAPAGGLQTVTGDAEYQRKLEGAVENLGRAYATHDVEVVKGALNNLIELTNYLVIEVQQ